MRAIIDRIYESSRSCMEPKNCANRPRRAVNRKAVSSECNGRCRTAKVMREQTIGGYAFRIVFAVSDQENTFRLIFIPFLRKESVSMLSVVVSPDFSRFFRPRVFSNKQK